MLTAAALLAISIGIIHSYLGEKYILMRLFRQPLPRLFGDDRFTKQTLRFVWHLLTVAWLGFAALLVSLDSAAASRSTLLAIVAATFATTGLVALIASRGRHLSWVIFFAISCLCFMAMRAP